MESVPGADRGPRAGSPRGVVDATGSQSSARIESARAVTRSLPLPVLTSSADTRTFDRNGIGWKCNDRTRIQIVCRFLALLPQRTQQVRDAVHARYRHS